MKNLMQNLKSNGLIPRVHGNKKRLPPNTVSLPVIEAMILFLENFTTRFGIPHPPPLYGHDGTPPMHLPAYLTKLAIHKTYVASCVKAGARAVGYDTFHDVW